MSKELLAVTLTFGTVALIFIGDIIIDVIRNKRAKKKEKQENERNGNTTKL